MGGVTDFLLDPMGAKKYFGGQQGQDPAVAQQQAELKKQQDAEKAKEDAANRQRMADMRARTGGGFGDGSGTLG